MSGIFLLLILPTLAYGAAIDTRVYKRQHHFDHCPNGSVRHDNSCYKVAHDLASWTDALVFCEAYGGHLARIDSAREQNFIAAHLKSVLSSVTDPGHYFWIGGTDAVSEGEWYWARIVEPLLYTNWSPGEPDNDNGHDSKHQDCLAIYGQNGKWDDGWCEDRHNFICEIENRGQDCLAIYGETGKWDDGWCEDRHNFICEIDIDSETGGFVG